MSTILKPLAVLVGTLPPMFVRALVVGLQNAYRDAFTKSSTVPPAMLKSALSYNRWLLGAVALHDVAAKFEQHGISVEFSQTHRNTHVYPDIFTPEFHITSHRVDGPDDLPARADYRENNSLDNWCYLIPSAQRGNGKKYVCLIHGPSDLRPANLGFARFVLPLFSERKYIDVYDLYMSAEFKFGVKPEREIAEVFPHLKSKKKQEEN